MDGTDVYSAIINLYTEKLKLAKEMLHQTQVAGITSDMESAERFISIVDDRDDLISKINQLNSELADQRYKDAVKTGSVEFQKELALLNEQTNVVVNDLIMLDKHNQSSVSSIMSEIKKNLKGLSGGKTVSNHYSMDSISDVVSKFNKTK